MVGKDERFSYYNSENLFNNWIKKVEKKGVNGINTLHSNLVIENVKDFSIGVNTAKGSKGSRSKSRLVKYQQIISFLLRLIEQKGIHNITKASDFEKNKILLHKLFDEFETGKIKTKDGKVYKSVSSFVKEMKTFWHWVQKSKKINIDITEDLSSKKEKPTWVYVDEEQFNEILSHLKYDIKPIVALAFDCGARTQELQNIKVNDFENDFKILNIREETSKTFGRKIKLMMCSEQIKKYVQEAKLKPNDYISVKSAGTINKELKIVFKKLFKEGKSKGGEDYQRISLYDFRHCSACFWLPKYKSTMAMMYRFGWKNEKMIHYYSEFLGMKDTIQDEDMFTDISKTELEKEIIKLKKENEKTQEVLEKMQKNNDKIMNFFDDKRTGKIIIKG